jgi:putative glutamine amidotransferase
MRPVILLTCTEVTKDTGDPSRQRPHALCDADTSDCRRDGLLMSYVRSVAAAGGTPLLLPNVPDAAAVESAIGAAQGLLLTGGSDVAAELYHARPHATMSAPDHDRDRTEMLAIQAAMRLRRPILGICRGIQVLNVALGGTLIQDIPSHLAAARPAAPLSTAEAPSAKSPLGHGNNATHDIQVDAGSILAGLWGEGSCQVNSSHHQAIDRPAGELRVIARAADGIIEAAQSADSYPLLALQCHPERLAHKEPRFAAVFAWLIRAAT